MSKRSRKPSMKVMENLETEEQLRLVEAVLYIVLMVTSRIKIMPFKLTGYCRLRSKEGKFKPRKEKNAKFMALQRQMESSQQRQTRLQDFSAREAICSQLETLEKRAIIYNFIL